MILNFLRISKNTYVRILHAVINSGNIILDYWKPANFCGKVLFHEAYLYMFKFKLIGMVERW